MIKTKCYLTPIDLGDLESQPEYERCVVLRIVQTLEGFDRITFALRGGTSEKLKVRPTEVVHIFPRDGRWELPAEERRGSEVRVQYVQWQGEMR